MGCTQGKLVGQAQKRKSGKHTSISLQKTMSSSAGGALAQSHKTHKSNSSFQKPQKYESSNPQSQLKTKLSSDGSKAIIPFSNESTKTTIKLDDTETLTQKGGNFQKIHAIKVAFSKDQIEGIQMAYEISNGNIVSGNDNNNFSYKEKSSSSSESGEIQNHQMEEVFEVPIDDYLVEIFGRSGTKLNQLQFKTQKGLISQPFGNQNLGRPFSLKKDGHTFGPISGHFSQCNMLLNLEVPIYPIPKDLNESQQEISE